jgi:hypothetical protein
MTAAHWRRVLALVTGLWAVGLLAAGAVCGPNTAIGVLTTAFPVLVTAGILAAQEARERWPARRRAGTVALPRPLGAEGGA